MIRSLPGRVFKTVQISDGRLEPAPGLDYLEDTLTNRLLPGEGEFDLTGIIAALQDVGADVGWDMEICSSVLDQLPGDEAARRAAQATLLGPGYRRAIDRCLTRRRPPHRSGRWSRRRQTYIPAPPSPRQIERVGLAPPQETIPFRRNAVISSVSRPSSPSTSSVCSPKSGAGGGSPPSSSKRIGGSGGVPNQSGTRRSVESHWPGSVDRRISPPGAGPETNPLRRNENLLPFLESSGGEGIVEESNSLGAMALAVGGGQEPGVGLQLGQAEMVHGILPLVLMVAEHRQDEEAPVPGPVRILRCGASLPRNGSLIERLIPPESGRDKSRAVEPHGGPHERAVDDRCLAGAFTLQQSRGKYRRQASYRTSRRRGRSSRTASRCR